MTAALAAARSKEKWQDFLPAMVFLAPNLIGFLTFTAIPVLVSATLSFFDWDIITWPPKFIGLDNYVRLLGWHREGGQVMPRDPLFWKCAWNTLFLMFAIPFNMMGSLALAWVLNQRLRGLVVFRTMVFLPSISALAAVALLWKWLYNPNFGLINYSIQQFGDLIGVPLQGPPWLTDPDWAKPALMIMGFWTLVGGMNMIYYLAALQGIPHELYEAAEIDGASAWSTFWNVTWPMISPTTFFMLTMSVIGGFQGGFIAAYMMTGGGPNNSTMTLEYYIFNNLYAYQHAGYAAAIAWVLFMVILGITVVHWRRSGKWVHYGI